MKPLNEYRKTRILTATPGELIVMLYDGLLGRVEGARKHLENGKTAEAGQLLSRAHDILHELIGCLERDKSPELAESLAALYAYCASLLVEGVGKQAPEKLREVYELLKPLRDAWEEANQQLKTGAAPKAVNE
jgi:flagellar protein FliS